MIKIKGTAIIYTFFFFSGAAGLIYEIVWGRMFVIIFGSTTNSMVAVISAFLSGLALGSILFAKLSDRQSTKSLLSIYALLEIGVGLTALATLFLFPLIAPLYSKISDGSLVTLSLIFVKFVMTFGILIFPTILMGATLPVLTNFIKAYYPGLGKNISMLYAVNTLGAVFGTALAAFLLIEYFGLKGTLYTAVLINTLIALSALIMKRKITNNIVNKELDKDGGVLVEQSVKRKLIFFITALSGLIAIAYQILWTRILTPAAGTFIYAFAEILIIYLLGIALGSLVYNKIYTTQKQSYLIFIISEFFIGIFALFSVFVTSLYVANFFGVSLFLTKFTIIPTIFPAAFFMGISFPAAIDALGEKKNHGSAVSLIYFYNTIGSIVGGFLASFFFIPYIGSTQSVMVLASFNFILAILLIINVNNFLKQEILKRLFYFSFSLFIFCFGLFALKGKQFYGAITQIRINQAQSQGLNYSFKEDEVGSVFASNNDKEFQAAQLIVDGIGMTSKDLETKLMAHVPIAIHKNPRDMLVICLGMGTTFRSAIKDGLNVDAVELSPSVAAAFPIFYADAHSLLEQPNTNIIINDGRNYVKLTNKTYDIMVIDPPPPFNSAGTTVLYSEDFYRDLAKKLKPGGLVNEWVYFGSNEDDIAMAIKSFVNVFPYVIVYYPPKDPVIGVNLLGSFTPIEIDDVRVEQIFSSQAVKEDFNEFGLLIEPKSVKDMFIANREDLLLYVNDFPAITDDRPRTEYFINRHNRREYDSMTIELFKERITR